MGMFDEIRCRFKLPMSQFQETIFQTTDTPNQCFDLYEIREDGVLWVQAYDTEDQSPRGKWEREHPGEETPPELQTFMAMCGCLSRVNMRWEPVADFIGEIRFYNTLGTQHNGWIEFSAYFVNSKLNQLHLVAHRPA